MATKPSSPHGLDSGAPPRRIRRAPRARARTGSPALLAILLILLGALLPRSPLHERRLTVVNGESSAIPRSTNRYASPTAADADPPSESSQSSTAPHHPPWNPSPQISPTGYLAHLYPRAPGAWEASADLRGRHGPRSRSYGSLSRIPARIRQVPGDGNCLFHSIAVGLHRLENGTDLCMDSPRSIRDLRLRSLSLRNRAVDTLLSNRRRLFLQGEEYLEARELLTAAAGQFDLGGEEYCELMRRESYWGGGPEIVALCNALQRPIHIYELIPAHKSDETPRPSVPSQTCPLSTQFALRRMACFGSPKFDRKDPLHILSADSRFPDVEPRKARRVGNHFLAVFPAEEERRGVSLRRPALVRGGEDGVSRGAEAEGRRDGRGGEERWDGGRGRWSAGATDSFVGSDGGAKGFLRRMERRMGPSVRWMLSRLAGFVAMSEVR